MKEQQAVSEKQRPSKRFWQSIEEKQNLVPSDWARPEFPEQAKQLRDEAIAKGFSRRDFLKFMGAGTVMATAACRRPVEQIVPAVKQPPEEIPGLPTFYSTTAPDGSGLIVRTRDGRPIKLAGNPDHPLTAGGATASTIASLMDLYDPDRLRKAVTFENKGPNAKKKTAAETAILAEARKRLAAGPYVLLTGPVDGPSSRALINEFLDTIPGGRHLELRPDPTLRQLTEGQRESYGAAVIPNYRFDRADLVVAIDADFLGTLVAPAYFTAAFASRRNLLKSKNATNRLVAFESMFTLTGSNADERHAIRPGDAALIALAIAAYLVVEKGRGGGDGRAILEKYTPAKVVATLGEEVGFYKKGEFEATIARIGDELWENRGKSLVITGSPLNECGHGPAAQTAVNLLNSILGNEGSTIVASQPIQLSPGASDSELAQLWQDLSAGKVKTLVVAGTNPVYHWPQAKAVSDALAKAEYVLALADRLDETAKLASAVLPLSHFLESWGDSELVAGIHGVQQPVIRPLYATRSLEDYLIQLAGGSLKDAPSFHEFVKARWRALAGGKNFRKFWVSVLQEGYYAPGRGTLKGGGKGGRNFKAGSLALADAAAKHALATKVSAGQLVLGLYYNIQVHDGALANNSLRQELPDPVTKITWDNYVCMLPDTARKLSLKQGSLIKIKTAGGELELPVHLQPGLHPGAALVALGYGRTDAGKIAECVGQNALALTTSDANGTHYALLVAAISATGERYRLASTQVIYREYTNDQDRMPGLPTGVHEVPYNGSSQITSVRGGKIHERPIVRETTWNDYKDGQFSMKPEGYAYPTAEKAALIPDWNYKDTRWHMVIDLNQCTGCGACVTSCNQENNIPMVGRDQVARGREMHWMRIDRYFSGEEDGPLVSHQPMLCQHCERAPCENVCPVAATTHNSEGLNVMTYNRCVGTRYCANNCPYKVRRFNWYENWYYMEGLVRQIRDPQHLGLNPDVTVRTRGVIEKCTFCIQRIAGSRQESRARGESYVPDGSVVTACQEVCPSQAIHFGNSLDPQSKVAKLAADKRGYKVLDFIGVNPSITYLARVRNDAGKGES